jgi:hypothetical protein
MRKKWLEGEGGGWAMGDGKKRYKTLKQRAIFLAKN